MVAALLLVLTAPVLLGVAVAIKFDTRGPVFSREFRVGALDAPFRLWKFRTFNYRTEQVASDRSWTSGTPEDAEFTRAGRVIHQFALDELPQLFNVVNGTMSLVGPRPHRALGLDGSVSWGKALRATDKPGMFGGHAAAGHSEERSVKRDLLVMWQTMRAAVSQD
ncbi:sugar transferase [Gordonia sp. CPCC 205515]|uniref:sugar transferase n=1 Tax=Gordonia sp. CPCC 205515 TaxID=3140791 RepID=UPI003AF3CFCC